MMTWMSDFSDKFPHESKENKVDSEKLSSQMELLKKEEVTVNKLRDQITRFTAHAFNAF